MNLPNTLKYSRIVKIEGGTSPIMKKFGASSGSTSSSLIRTIMTKNEPSKVAAKNKTVIIRKPTVLMLALGVSFGIVVTVTY
ncbi:MAG: hypothetical protein ACREA4_07915 [Nitrososphaera sp.]